MIIVVTPCRPHPHRGIVTFGTERHDCVLGRSGVRTIKIEGDGATPAGRFPLRRLLYRADRLAAPITALPIGVIAPDDGWCDAPGDAAYNRPVKLPYPASTESMMRTDHLYDLVVIVGHNDDPVIAGAGSAIFIHVAPPDGAPTAGCVGLAQPALLALLGAVDRTSVLEIRPAP